MQHRSLKSSSSRRERLRALFAALVVILGALWMDGALAESPREVYEREINRRLDADDGLAKEERARWRENLLAGFEGAFDNMVSEREYMLDAVDTIFHIMIEGIFAELPPAQVVPVARAAFDARKTGAPAAAVEGIAQYGLSDYVRDQGIEISALEIAGWASGSEAAKRVGVPDFIAEDFVAQALEARWGIDRYVQLNSALIRAVAEGHDAEVAGRYLLISMELGEKSAEEIVAEMEPYLQKIRREKAGEKLKEMRERQEEEQGRGEPAKPETKPKSQTRTALSPVPGQYNPFAGQRTPGAAQPTAPQRPATSTTSNPRKPASSGPLMGVVPAAPAKQQTATAKPTRPAEQAPRSTAPVSSQLVSAKPNSIVGLVSRGALDAEIDTWIGTPYKWGGTKKIYGADCSGFTQGSLRAVKIGIPRVSRDQAQVGRYLNADGARNLSYGDLVFFDTTGRGTKSRVSHVGVYLQNGRMAHASSSKGIMKTDFTRRYYQSKYMFGRRVTQFTR